MVTTWTSRVKPNTAWGERAAVSTDWDGRTRPITYMTPLEDAYDQVADDEDRVIFVLSDSGKVIPATFWKGRKVI